MLRGNRSHVVRWKKKKKDVTSSHPALGHQVIYYCGCFLYSKKNNNTVVFPQWMRQVARGNKGSAGEPSLP